jgi:hypothetical protein
LARDQTFGDLEGIGGSAGPEVRVGQRLQAPEPGLVEPDRLQSRGLVLQSRIRITAPHTDGLLEQGDRLGWRPSGGLTAQQVEASAVDA